MGKKKDFCWRYQPPIDSDSAKLLSYIQNSVLHPDLDTKGMMLKALNAHYLPLALLNESSLSAQKLESVGLECVFALLRQVDYLCAALGIDRTQLGGIVPVGVQPRLMPRSQGVATIEEEVDSPSLDSFDEDEWNVVGLSPHQKSYT